MTQELSDRQKLAQPKIAVQNGDGASPVVRGGVRKRSFFGVWFWLMVIILVAAAALVYFFVLKHAPAPAPEGASNTEGGTATGAHHGHRGASDKIRVVTAEATKGDIGVYLTGLGAVTPLNTDTVQSRVSGQLMNVLYQEGQMVKAGDLLLQIDSRPYEAQLAQYVAQKEHDVALLEDAKIDLDRYQTLYKENSIQQQTLETQIYLVKEDQGTVDSDQALIDATKLNITYCNITAPISGKVGLRLVDPGNYVQSTSTTGLVVITQIQPITVIFTIPEGNIDPVLSKLNAHQELQVEAQNSDRSKNLAAGTLLTTDNQIDPTTGTLRLRAIFPNQDNALFPNQFVNARLLVDMKKNVTLVPLAAIQQGNSGTFVYVVNTNEDTHTSTVSMQDVTEGTVDGETAEITKGISPGDVVVIDGVDKLQNGSKVIVQKKGAAAPASSASAAGSDGITPSAP